MTARGPNTLTQATAQGLDGPTEVRTGTVVEVTSRGITVAVAEGLVPAAHLDSYAPAVGDPVAMANYRDSWLALGRPVGAGTAVDLATPGSAAGTTLLGGTVLSGANIAGIASSTGSLVPVPRYRCTYYHPPGHYVMIWCGLTWYCTVAADTMEASLWDAVTATQVGSMVFNQSSNNFYSRFESSGQVIPPSYGGRKVDVYMQIQRLQGTGTSRIDDAPIRRGYLIALDLGDQSVISVV